MEEDLGLAALVTVPEYSSVPESCVCCRKRLLRKGEIGCQLRSTRPDARVVTGFPINVCCMLTDSRSTLLPVGCDE